MTIENWIVFHFVSYFFKLNVTFLQKHQYKITTNSQNEADI